MNSMQSGHHLAPNIGLRRLCLAADCQRGCSPSERGVLQTPRLQTDRPAKFQLPQRQYQSLGPNPRSRGSLHLPPLPLQKPRLRQLWLLQTRHLQSPACHSCPGTHGSPLSSPGTSTAADPRGFFLDGSEGCDGCRDGTGGSDCCDCASFLGMALAAGLCFGVSGCGGGAGVARGASRAFGRGFKTMTLPLRR